MTHLVSPCCCLEGGQLLFCELRLHRLRLGYPLGYPAQRRNHPELFGSAKRLGAAVDDCCAMHAPVAACPAWLKASAELRKQLHFHQRPPGIVLSTACHSMLSTAAPAFGGFVLALLGTSPLSANAHACIAYVGAHRSRGKPPSTRCTGGVQERAVHGWLSCWLLGHQSAPLHSHTYKRRCCLTQCTELQSIKTAARHRTLRSLDSH